MPYKMVLASGRAVLGDACMHVPDKVETHETVTFQSKMALPLASLHCVKSSHFLSLDLSGAEAEELS